MIQLSLNKLLSRIKANPKNQVVEREWSESRSQALRSSQRNKEITNTLEKKSITPRYFLKSSDRRTETSSDLRRTHSLELDASPLNIRSRGVASNRLPSLPYKTFLRYYNKIAKTYNNLYYNNKLSQYLKNRTVKVNPLIFWRENERQYPVLASLTHDILSIPATGVGVKRLFNSTRDIYHYRRGSLNTITIKDLMIFIYTTRFDIKEKQLAFIKDFLIKEE
ncbi:hypothetical protein N7524_010877 [Penicillium chrysogenum]|nr:hypothetical protein N7524_010877 [Penicillium chrysogenum]